MDNKPTITFEEGRKRTRGELRLPQLHFIAMDDWVKKLGHRAFIAWLQFYTFVDRTDSSTKDSIPKSMKDLAKKLEVSEPTLYNTIIRPLWNYGMIDIKERLVGKTTYKNIIVYEYPQNDPALSTKPLEKIRDYDRDYHSVQKAGGKLGAKMKQEKSAENPTQGSLKNFKLGSLKNIKLGSLKKFKVGGLTKFKLIIKSNKSINQSKHITNAPNKKSNVSNVSQSVEFPTSLPHPIQKAMIDIGLTDRLTEITNVFESVKDQNGFSVALFIQTLQKDALRKAARDKKGVQLERYLRKAVLNNVSELVLNVRPAEQEQPILDAIDDPITKVMQDVMFKRKGLPKSQLWQDMTSAVQETFGLSWSDARKEIERRLPND
ncbi:hypothetical protein [Brevibacillus marinus]|uniref:hypothetical protein n=1 Tax=Brevibacillus marinus TaxID=2496837 RepID=UPI000F831DE1|nr:hypothetical protein [Brevibacillus marinus]